MCLTYGLYFFKTGSFTIYLRTITFLNFFSNQTMELRVKIYDNFICINDYTLLYTCISFSFEFLCFLVWSFHKYGMCFHLINLNYVFAAAHMSNLKEETNKIMTWNMIGPSGKINHKYFKSIHYHFFFLFWTLKLRNDFFNGKIYLSNFNCWKVSSQEKN